MADDPKVLMANAARNNKCEHYAFRQKELIAQTPLSGTSFDEGGQGICFGLAVTWLEQLKKGKLVKVQAGETPGFLGRVSNWSGNPAFRRAHVLFLDQGSKQWQKETGLAPALDSTGGEKKKGYALTLDDMTLFTRWLAASLGTRYFLIHVKKHTMAAAGAKIGKLTFFDPNGGIVISNSSTNLAACLFQYFNEPLINEHYREVDHNRPRIFMSVDKLK